MALTSTLPRVLLIWPYGISGAESIPMFASFLAPQLRGVAETALIDCSLNHVHPRSASVRCTQRQSWLHAATPMTSGR